ncbi:hypothetical protein AJ87_33460 [Rhizobium yanglingense]|nr:hypothetical protein AJ87_33460 [Rhizobium yanglingense]
MRQQHSKPLIVDMELWMREQRAKLSRSNDQAKAFDYMLGAGAPSPASSTMAVSACRTTPPSAHCAASLLGGELGCFAADRGGAHALLRIRNLVVIFETCA